LKILFFTLPLFIELFKIFSYSLLSLNCRWFTFIIPLTRALEVVSPSGSWHPTIPRASRRSLLSHSWRSLLSRNRRSLLSHSRRSPLSHSRRSLLSPKRRSLVSQRRTLSTTRVIAMTHQSTPHSVTQMTQTQCHNLFEQLRSSAHMVRSH
jgi:hypothetical protein